MANIKRATEPSDFIRKDSEYRIKAVNDGLDAVAHAMEEKWGFDRLRLLVPDALRARFDRQQDRVYEASYSAEEAKIILQAEAMKRAWIVLDQAATEAGAAILDPEVWECILPSTGEVVAVVRTQAEAHKVAKGKRTFSMSEIGILIDGLKRQVLEIKRTFPGASVIAVYPVEEADKFGPGIPF